MVILILVLVISFLGIIIKYYLSYKSYFINVRVFKRKAYILLLLLSRFSGKMAVSIKISEETYKRLVSLSGKLQEQLARPVSINEAIEYLYKKPNLMALAGSWKMSDEEADAIIKDIRKGWKQWSARYA